MKFTSFILAVLLSTPIAFSAVGGKEDLRIALNAEFDTLNPIVNSTMAAVNILDATLRPLVVLSPAGEMRPVLIREIPTVENQKITLINKGKGGLKAQLEFLPDAKWGDGTDLTCNDLKLSWEIGNDPNVSTPNREDFSNITEVNVDLKNPKFCTVTLKLAKWNFLLNLPRPLPVHLEGPVYKKFKSEPLAYDRNSNYNRNIATQGLYNGPYYVSELKQGSHVILTQNPNYFGQKPYFKKIIMKFITNTATLEANLVSGNVDLLSSSGLSFDQALNFEKKIKRETLPFEMQIVPGVLYQHIDLNMSNAALSDVKVRQALNYAVDRKELVQALFEGRTGPAYHFSVPLDSWYTEDAKDITVYNFSAAKARTLLTEAGWIEGKDGYRYKNGKKLSLELIGAADNKMIQMIQAYLQESWKKVGVEILTKNYPSRVLFGEMIRKRKFDMALYAWVSSPNEIQKLALHSSMIPSEKNAWSGTNRTGWVNKNVDQWLEQAETEFDSKKRIAIMKNVLKAYTAEVPAIPLFYRGNNSVSPKGLKNYRISGHNFTEFLEIENWRY